LTFAGGDDPLTAPLHTWMPRRKMSSDMIMEQNGRYVCGVCQQSYSNRSSCVSHFDVHLGTTTCRICSKVLADKHALMYHLAKHQGRIRCELCNSTFINNAKLNRHKRTSRCGKANFSAQQN
jgi:hypothetical protein